MSADPHSRPGRIEELFTAVYELDAVARAAYLASACAGEPELLHEVETLLRAHDQASGLFAGVGSAQAASPDAPAPHGGGAFDPGQMLHGGRFRVVRLLGRGGMGEVYEAEDLGLGVRVALKTLAPEIARDADATARFKGEIAVARRVTHANVCRIHELFSDGASTFLAMELLEGETLWDWIRRRGRLGPADALPLLRDMVAALEALHGAGVIHRDFKSRNVMLVADGRGGQRAVVTDFGLSRNLAGLEVLGAAGAAGAAEPCGAGAASWIAGTPAYMAPEQLLGIPADARADVFSLGVVMFEMLNGHLPFAGLGVETGFKWLVVDPARFEPLPPELETTWGPVLRRCLQRDPADRFPSAGAVLEAVVGERRRRRRRWTTAVAGVALAASLGAAVTTARAWQRERRLGLARELSVAARDQLGADPRLALLLAAHAVQATHAADGSVVPVAEDVLHQALQSSRFRRSWVAGDLDLTRVAWLAGDRHLLTAGLDGTARVFDARSGLTLRVLRHPAGVRDARPSPVSAAIVTTAEDGVVRLWASKDDDPVELGRHAAAASSASWSPDARRIATAAMDGSIRVWDVAARALQFEVRHLPAVRTVAFRPDGRAFATASTDGGVRVWDAATGEVRRELRGHVKEVWEVSWSPDGRRLASGSADLTTRVWDAETGQELVKMEGWGLSDGLSVAWTTDGKRLVQGHRDSVVTFADPLSGRLLEVLRGQRGGILSVAGSGEDRWLASVTNLRALQVWHGGAREEVSSMRAHDGFVGSLAWQPGGRRLATGGDDGRVRIWEAGGTRPGRTFDARVGTVLVVAWSPDGARVAAGYVDGSARIWALDRDQPVATLTAARATTRAVAWSRDGRWLALGSNDDAARIWDVETGEVVRTLAHPGDVMGLEFGPRGLLATACRDSGTRIWSADTGELVHMLPATTSAMHVAWSPEDDRLAVATWGGVVTVWDVASWQSLYALEGHESGVFQVAWSADGKQLATASADDSVRVWDAGGRSRFTARSEGGDAASVAWRGTRIAAGFDDGTVRVFETDPGEALRLARVRAGRDLTPEECRRWLHAGACPPLP